MNFAPPVISIATPSSIELITSNPVQKEDVDLLRSRIDNVNKQNREELKDLYKSTITNGKFSSQRWRRAGFY